MPLFRCSKCGCVENTALSGFWKEQYVAYKDEREMAPLCSACDPEIGAWHGRFPQDSAAGWFIDQFGHLWRGTEKLSPAIHIVGVVPDDPPEGA